jgi:hypothetical protein
MNSGVTFLGHPAHIQLVTERDWLLALYPGQIRFDVASLLCDGGNAVPRSVKEM